MIRRPPRSTQSRSSAASDVYKRQANTRDVCLSKVDKVGKKEWASKSYGALNSLRYGIRACGALAGALLSPGYSNFIFPMTRWNWDETKYSTVLSPDGKAGYCNGRPGCKEAWKDYPEFPLFVSSRK
eukprot:TRINITY_DN14387_c0_g1_i1.p1 TRINITY_DN14387_c0_g1~~TRINITY_DN14387_c0_g1_i1.p1  ORF type:complete len:127 (-),score=22.41 TRINITY_DN14387_c0_g1_i1:453-833(-)